MLDVQAALAKADIPGYRVSMRLGEMTEIPTVFAAWAMRSHFESYRDDAPGATVCEVKMNLVAASDPQGPWERLLAPMIAEGYEMLEMQESYDEDADVYVLQSTWRGVRYHDI